MEKIKKNLKFFLSLLLFLSLLNLALYLQVPLILQLLGLIAAGIVPGYLLCLLFRITVSDRYQNFLYAVGLSIVFDILFGLTINTVLGVLENPSPLSADNIRILYTGTMLAMMVLILWTDRAQAFTLQLPQLGRCEKWILIFGFAILICAEAGIYLINANITNALLIFSVILIPVLLFLCIIWNEKVKRTYPVLLVLIGASLTLILALRSNYVLGIDINEEYYLFYQTFTGSRWIPDPSILLGSSLSVSLLPTMFENFLCIDTQLLYKLLFPLLFMVIPLVIFTTVRKFTGELPALFATCFFMFQNYYVGVAALARTSVAIFFLSFTVMVLFDKELSYAKKHALILLFITGTVFSHYTSSFIILFILIIAYGLDLILTLVQGRKENRLINLPFIIFLMSLILFWYLQVIDVVFKAGVEFTVGREDIFNSLLKNETSTYSVAAAYIPPPTFIGRWISYSRIALFVLIGIGVLFALYQVICKKSACRSDSSLSWEVGSYLIGMGCIATVILFLTNFASVLFYKYETGRTQALLFVILPLFLITGAFTLFRCEEILPIHTGFPRAGSFIRLHREKIIAGFLLFLLVPQLISATYISNELTGGPYSITLHPPRYSPEFDQNREDPLKFAYIYDQDAAVLTWFNNHTYRTSRIFSDPYGNKKITVFVNRSSSLYQPSLFILPEEDAGDVYIFVSYANGFFGHFSDYNNVDTPVTVIDPLTSRKNRIYANGAVVYQ